MTADHIAMAIYICTIMSIPAHVGSRQPAAGAAGDGAPQQLEPPQADAGSSTQRAPVTAESLALALAAATLACALGTWLADRWGAPSLGLGLVSALASALAAAGTQLARRFGSRSRGGGGGAAAVHPFAGAEALGGAGMMVFFASIGSTAGSVSALRGSGWLLVFILLQLRCGGAGRSAVQERVRDALEGSFEWAGCMPLQVAWMSP